MKVEYAFLNVKMRNLLVTEEVTFEEKYSEIY